MSLSTWQPVTSCFPAVFLLSAGWKPIHCLWLAMGAKPRGVRASRSPARSSVGDLAAKITRTNVVTLRAHPTPGLS